jgi:L-methionine (R)-S-oxide reductase
MATSDAEDISQAILASLRCDKPRAYQAADIAELIRSVGPYRWTGLYDVDLGAGLVSVIAWSGPSGPEFPVFPITKGLTSRAIATKRAVNAGNVSEDPDYLTALATTQSEIVVPILSDDRVVGTLDIESEVPHAFDSETQARIERYALLITDLWKKP